MTIYKQPGSPYYYYDFYFEKRRYQASTHLRNKTVAHRVECIKKAELAQRRAGILPKNQIPLFRGFAERFLHTVKVERRPNTHRAYLSCVRNLEAAFGRKYLDEITPEICPSAGSSLARPAWPAVFLRFAQFPSRANFDYREIHRDR